MYLYVCMYVCMYVCKASQTSEPPLSNRINQQQRTNTRHKQRTATYNNTHNMIFVIIV